MDEVFPLKKLCLDKVRQNSILQRRNTSVNFGRTLFYELSKKVSPYGLHLLENLTSICVNLDHIFLSQWSFPPSYLLKARKRIRDIMMTTTFTNKQFFYDSVLNEVIEQLMYPQPVNECFQKAADFILEYPFRNKYVCTEKENVSLDSREFISLLSLHVSTLTINLSVANKIMENRDIFMPILSVVEHLNLNLQMKASQHQYLGRVLAIIKIARCGKLKSVRVNVRKKSVLNTYDYFEDFLEALFHPLTKNLLTGISYKPVDLNSSLDDIYDDSVENKNNMDVSLNENKDEFYDLIFQDKKESNTMKNKRTVANIDTKIVDFDLSAAECQHYPVFLDYISKWRNLQKLSIHGYNYVEDLKMTAMFEGLATMNNLKELTLSEFWNESLDEEIPDSSQNALIQFVKPSCQKHETVNSLRKLNLLNCHFNRNFLYAILCHKPTEYCRRTTDECNVDGLHAIHITALPCPSDELSLCLRDNKTLKDLTVTISSYCRNEDILFDEASNSGLQTFSLSCPLKPVTLTTPPNLQKLLRKTSLKHLVLSQICQDNYIFSGPGWEDALCSSNLTTLIWTKNGLDNDGIIDFTGYLRCLKYLRFLDLSGNLFDYTGISTFLFKVDELKHFFKKLALGGCKVARDHKEMSKLESIIKENVDLFLCAFTEMDPSDHIAEM